MPDTNTLLLAFGLTLLAGLSTGVGSALAFFTKHTNTKVLSIALGFSAGVMIYVSFVEIFCEARENLTMDFGHETASWLTVIAFFGGIAFIAIIDKFIPTFENPHEAHRVEEMQDPNQAKRIRKLFRMGLFTALVIAAHNFPEGLATFTATLTNPHLGIAIAFAIAIHNIPEGIAVSIPIYYSTRSKRKAFKYSLLSGLAEPAGALIGYLILAPFFSPTVFGIMFAGVAGIMVFISLDQLLPTAREYGEHHLSIYGLLLGMSIMALSLLLCM